MTPVKGDRQSHASASHALWGGRFASSPAEALAALNDSLAIDRRLWPYDIRGSRAWVAGLAAAGVVTAAEASTLDAGLARVAARLAAGGESDAADEDVHTLVERMLYDEVGEVAGKLHTGRSRNDQVATDLRLWCRDAIDRLDALVCELGQALVAQGERGVDHLLPGYTHGQQAQVVRWGFVLAAHAWPLTRDRERLAEVRRRTGRLPLGSGALAGSAFPVDRDLLRRELEFEALVPNALDATGDRDFVAELVFAVALLAVHLSRLSGEMFTYCSTEFGFVRLGDAFATGSSLMPHKKNPDVFELARAKAARVHGRLTALLGMLHGLPAGYNKDMQEDKPPVFDAVDTMEATLPAVTGAMATLEPVPERMRAALSPGLLATDVADGLVHAGVPFREAHGVAGRLVREAEDAGIPFPELPEAASAAIHPALPGVLRDLGSFDESVERRVTEGGTGRASVISQLQALRAAFAS